MSRRPSVLSVISSSSSQLGNGQLKGNAPSIQQSISTQSGLGQLPQLADGMDPDDLFTKCTVSEVRRVQQKLRADADAKQEELRLMVGERYRDLLQASTSIISIARSSKRVTEALEETKSAILAQEEPPLPKRYSVQGNNDTHLHTLQVLSAHMKLLLDAPEHLWRLIEKKDYFTAAWLFLLSRVVHRALVRDDEQDDETWGMQGLDVLEQFPLIQRQWESVSQFRSQIVHKASLFLREFTASPTETCATLLTIHLLDSRPLTATFVALLEQRTKTLTSLLSWNADAPSPISPSKARAANGHAPEQSMVGEVNRLKPSLAATREVKQAILTGLDAISQTLKTSKTIFWSIGPQPPLIEAVLEYIQSDSSEPHDAIPEELQLTTHLLLMNLPSSTHFLLLPANLRSYKPYVDLTSSSSRISQPYIIGKLDDWYNKSTASLRSAVEQWFLEVSTVKDVWNLRSAIRKWIYTSSGLEEVEIAKLASIFDDLSRQRVLAIWKGELTGAERAFRDSLSSAVSTLNRETGARSSESSPVHFLFQAPPLLPASQGGAPTDSSFPKYKAALRKQLLGRTSMLDDVLKTLENCAKSLQYDLSQVLAGDPDDDRSLVDQLKESYHPDAETICSGIVNALESSAENCENTDSGMSSLVFVGRIADELESSSPFVADLGCSEIVAGDFRTKTRTLHDHVIDRWRRYTVARIVGDHRLALHSLSQQKNFTSIIPSLPSPSLIESLLSLSGAIEQLGLSRRLSLQDRITDATLHHFIKEVSAEEWELDDLQALHDIALLRKLADRRASGWKDVRVMLDTKAACAREKVRPEKDLPNFDVGASEYLSRTQILFATLLPPTSPQTPPASGDKLATLLPHGAPKVEQQFHSAMDLAKPSPRFGLLLVGSVGR